MALDRLWAGRAYGTNTGNIFVKLDGTDADLNGTLHMNEPAVGLVVYTVHGSFDGNELRLMGSPQIEGFAFGQLAATARLDAKGELRGEWGTDIGSAGTFVLFPHGQGAAEVAASGRLPDQLFTSRYQFGAVEVDRDQIIAIADEIQRDFEKTQVVVTADAGPEHSRSRLLSDFKAVEFVSERATIIRLFAQEPEDNGINRVVQVEFSPQINMVMVQGSDEALVLGTIEKLKRRIRPFERTYMTNFKKYGLGFNQVLLVGTIVFLPSLGGLLDRAILMFGVLALIFAVILVARAFSALCSHLFGTQTRRDACEDRPHCHLLVDCCDR